ncbi:hypothetical protein [Caballeronia sp. INSB1]|uniref:hypothetical protein n=1 Tax=Caballeronia sp. INSB1 TaxID=2921751 RepID=UPI002032E369|nr:hypothetical protein [Caballeronia sp. INSB1]
MPPDSVEQVIQTIADFAELPLDSSRVATIAPILAAWIKDANALSLKMRSSEFLHVAPITGFLQTVNHGEVSNEQ